MNNKIELENKLLADAIRRDGMVEFQTGFDFLRQHNGWRRGKVHVLVGSQGIGKSTLTRSLVTDLVTNNPKVKIGWWLSEESVSTAKKGLYRQQKTIEPFLGVTYASEVEINSGHKSKFEMFVNKCDMDFLIFDNLSTSSMYNKYDDQVEVLARLKAAANRLDIPVFLVIHTAKGISYNSMVELTGADIKGAGKLGDIAEFLYIAQEFRLNGKRHQYIKIDKHRDQYPDDLNYKLEFCPKTKHHVSDRAVDYTTIVAIRKRARDIENGKEA